MQITGPFIPSCDFNEVSSSVTKSNLTGCCWFAQMIDRDVIVSNILMAMRRVGKKVRCAPRSGLKHRYSDLLDVQSEPIEVRGQPATWNGRLTLLMPTVPY